MEMEDETYVASENMKKFFEKLLALKQYVKKKRDEMHDETLKHIYVQLDSIIKEKNAHE